MSAGNPFETNAGLAQQAENPFAPPPQSATSQVFGAGQIAPNGGTGLDQTQEAPEPIDLNDPLLISESLTVAEGDAFADPPPPPDGRYRVKLKLIGVPKEGSSEVDPYIAARDIDNKTGQVRGLFLKTKIGVNIIDPTGKYDGLSLGIKFSWMDTKPNRDGVSKVMTVLNLLKQPSGQPWINKGERLNHKELMERFVKALAGEPEIGVESSWEYNCRGCSDEAKVTKKYQNAIEGMNKFPVDKERSRPGVIVYLPERECVVNKAHGFSRARAMVARFIGLGEVK